MPAYYTVVYRITGDQAARDAWWQTIQLLLLADGGPVRVSAISAADEIARLDCIGNIVEGRQHRDDKLRAIEEMLVHPDPLAWWRENAGQTSAGEATQ
jgi:hypothetical protein